jgi:hypothetical protein
MYKSTPLLMVQDNKQISAVKLIACYQYRSEGEHLVNKIQTSNDALTIDIYGIDKTGDRNLIAKCPLTTGSGYGAMAYASNTVSGIPVKQYNYIMYEYDTAKSPDFANLIGQPILTVDVQEYSDMLDSSTQETAVIN